LVQKKLRRDNIKKFKENVNKYRYENLPNDYPEPKCLSDQGLLWLRYGMWKLTDFYGRNFLAKKWDTVDYLSKVVGETDSIMARTEEQRGEKFEDFCVRLYNDIIRGNMDYTNRPMVPAVAALLYICCIVYGVQTTQKDISQIYNTTEATLRKFYHEMMTKIDKGEITDAL
jgi:hypothetical protein